MLSCTRGLTLARCFLANQKRRLLEAPSRTRRVVARLSLNIWSCLRVRVRQTSINVGSGVRRSDLHLSLWSQFADYTEMTKRASFARHQWEHPRASSGVRSQTRVDNRSPETKRGASDMSSVWKRLQRVNKRAAKFQFTVSYHEVTLETTTKWWAILLFIIPRHTFASIERARQMSLFVSVTQSVCLFRKVSVVQRKKGVQRLFLLFSNDFCVIHLWAIQTLQCLLKHDVCINLFIMII